MVDPIQADAEAFRRTMEAFQVPTPTPHVHQATLTGTPGPAGTLQIIPALIEVMRAVTHVGKDGYNEQQRYNFRGIDGVMNAVGPAARQHGVLAVPHRVDITYRDAMTTGQQPRPTREVVAKVTYRFYAADGSYIEAIVPGESLDQSDKGSAKAMSVALRIAWLQILTLPTQEPTTDHDGHYHTRAGNPGLSQFERQTGLALLRVPLPGERAAAGADMMRAALAQAIDFKACIDEHAAWLTPTDGDESPTWGDLFAVRIAAEVEAIDTAAEGAALFATLKAAQLLDLEYEGKRMVQLMKERSQAIKDRNAAALNTITQQVLNATTEEELLGPVIDSVTKAHALERLTAAEHQQLLQLIGERCNRLQAQGVERQELPTAEPPGQLGDHSDALMYESEDTK